ncbi:MAG: ABC transporter permease [Solirubrobacteraceae bacterium]
MLLVNAFRFIGQHADMLVSRAGSQLLLSAAALGVAIAVSLPIGLVTGHLRRWSSVAIGGANVLRALPTLAVVAVGLGLYGFGFVNIMIALAILGIPPILNNTYVAISSVPRATVDAGRGLGMRPWQVLLAVELPNSVPLILGGIRTASVYIIATAYLASFAGIDATLGTVITNEGAYGLSGVLGATIVIVALAFAVEALLALLQHFITPLGLRGRARLRSEGASV